MRLPINQEEQMPRNLTRTRFRLAILLVLALLPGLLLAIRLHRLQIVHGQEFQAKADAQRTKYVVTKPVRGQIFSSDGQILVGNRAHYDLVLSPSDMRHPGGYIHTSTEIISIASYLWENIMKRPYEGDLTTLRRRLQENMALPVVLYRDLTETEIAQIAEMPHTDGLEILPRIERDYPFPGLASHLLGMTRHSDDKNSILKQIDTLPANKYSIFTSDEIIGLSGLEKQFNPQLAGSVGIKIIQQDARGFVRSELPGTTSPVDGLNLFLTLDVKAQIAAENALEGLHGALVAVRPQDGAVLAMASAPSFHLEQMDAEQLISMNQDEENRPLFNRALQGEYMPGSIIKPLVALAALESGTITTHTHYDCTGYHLIGNHRIYCAKRYGHGILDLEMAIAVSCNPYFIHTGLLCGLDILQPFYQSAGIGQDTGFDIPTSANGLLPSRGMALKRWKRKWNISDTAYASMGQGAIEVTPLQAAIYTAALANGGTIWRPYVVRQLRTKSGLVIHETPPRPNSHIPATPEHFAFVRRAMTTAVEGRNTSANALLAAGIPLAAKTGTAEVQSHGERFKNTWIICYGPLPKPSFAVACVIENGDSGGRTTAPVVVDFLKNWPGIGKE